MRPPLRLTSADNPRLKAVVRLREQRERRKTGLFIAEGAREVTRALQAGLTLRELFICTDHAADVLPSLRDFDGVVTDAKHFEVTAALFRKIAYNENPEGLLGVFEQPDWARSEDWPPSILRQLERDRTTAELWLVTAGIEKPGNLGAMVRSLEAAGGWGVFNADAVVDPFNPNAIRASTGAVFSVPVIAAGAERIFELLRRRKVKLVVTSPAAKRAYSDVDLTGPTAIAIGAEDRGLGEAWFAAAEATGGAVVGIPMLGRTVDSLNASTAAAVLLFEAVRQRRAPRPPG
jgi:RNA methyltransferase, TrmH family